MSSLNYETHDGIDGVEPDEWNTLVQHASEGSVFYRHEWFKAYEQALDVEASHVVVRNDGSLVGALPGYRSPLGPTPFSTLGPPDPGFTSFLTTTREDEVLDLLLDESGPAVDDFRLLHTIKPLEHDHVRHSRTLRRHGYHPDVLDCRFLIDLTGTWEEVLEAMDQDRRRNCRRAMEMEEGQDVTVRRFERGDVDRFHERHAQMLRGQGKPPVRRALFDALAGRLTDELLLVSAECDDGWIGEVLCVLDEERDTIHGLFSGINGEMYDRYPTELLYGTVLRWGIDREYDYCDLGGTKASRNDGVFRFKSQFGGRIYPTIRWRRVATQAGHAMYEAAQDIYLRHEDAIPLDRLRDAW